MPVELITGQAGGIPRTRVDRPEVRAALEAAFAGELQERLPALRAALAAHPPRGGEAHRHAHTLASSCAVLGHPDASGLLRAAEIALADGDVTRPHELARAGRLVERAAALLTARRA